ncbi:MAG: hypothetical protein JXQ29_05400 [Planctomycetes bacterium]|nr:hypothetical protein [Planctomycetota bacterium]
MKHPGLAVLILTAGCGYSAGSLYDPAIRSVAVDVFRNETFRRDLELALTGKVVQQIRLRTPWRIANRGEADAFLTGRIVDVHEILLSKTPSDLNSESSVAVTVEAELVERGTGRVLRSVRRMSSEAFLLPRGESVTTALDRSLTDLAEDIVQGLEDWR